MVTCSTDTEAPPREETDAIRGSSVKALFNALYPAAAKWREIGLALDCPLCELRKIEHKPANKEVTHFMLDLLEYRESVITPSSLTWKVIIHALRQGIVHEERLANKIAREHCPQEERNFMTTHIKCATIVSSARSHEGIVAGL